MSGSLKLPVEAGLQLDLQLLEEFSLVSLTSHNSRKPIIKTTS
jgi:hypothetical protein